MAFACREENLRRKHQREIKEIQLVNRVRDKLREEEEGASRRDWALAWGHLQSKSMTMHVEFGSRRWHSQRRQMIALHNEGLGNGRVIPISREYLSTRSSVIVMFSKRSNKFSKMVFDYMILFACPFDETASSLEGLTPMIFTIIISFSLIGARHTGGDLMLKWIPSITSWHVFTHWVFRG